MELLQECGLLGCCEERNYLVKTGAEFLRGDERCSFAFAQQHTDGFAYTWQVPRDDFDKTLADAVEAMGVPIHYRHELVDASFGVAPVVTVKTPEGALQQIRTKFVIDASGYGRVLPRLLDLNTPSHLPVRHSLFTWIDNDDREPGELAGRTWVAMHPGGAWIWAIPFADGKTSVGIVAEPEFFEAWPTDPTERFTAIVASEPNIAHRLRNATVTFKPVLIEGYSVGIKQLFGPGWCLVGNTTEFLDPVFYSGITLALESAIAGVDDGATRLALFSFLRISAAFWPSNPSELSASFIAPLAALTRTSVGRCNRVVSSARKLVYGVMIPYFFDRRISSSITSLDLPLSWIWSMRYPTRLVAHIFSTKTYRMSFPGGWIVTLYSNPRSLPW